MWRERERERETGEHKKVTTCVKSNLSKNGICHLGGRWIVKNVKKTKKKKARDKPKQIVSKFDLMPI